MIDHHLSLKNAVLEVELATPPAAARGAGAGARRTPALRGSGALPAPRGARCRSRRDGATSRRDGATRRRRVVCVDGVDAGRGVG
jgi:hypothetical protein